MNCHAAGCYVCFFVVSWDHDLGSQLLPLKDANRSTNFASPSTWKAFRIHGLLEFNDHDSFYFGWNMHSVYGSVRLMMVRKFCHALLGCNRNRILLVPELSKRWGSDQSSQSPSRLFRSGYWSEWKSSNHKWIPKNCHACNRDRMNQSIVIVIVEVVSPVNYFGVAVGGVRWECLIAHFIWRLVIAHHRHWKSFHLLWNY